MTKANWLQKQRVLAERSAITEKWNGTQEHLDRIMRSKPDIADMLAPQLKCCPGYLAFGLYSTYGIAIDSTVDFFERKGWTVDIQEFERLLEADREQSRKASRFSKRIFEEMQI